LEILLEEDGGEQSFTLFYYFIFVHITSGNTGVPKNSIMNIFIDKNTKYIVNVFVNLSTMLVVEGLC
jgi:hypothetical protein